MENVWLNLPVKNLDKTDQFYKTIGFKPNGKKYKNEELVSFLAGSNKLIVHFFKQKIFEKFVSAKATNTAKSNEIIITIGSKTKKEIEKITAKVEAAGGKVIAKPARDDGYFGSTFADPDGHKWNFLLLEKGM